MCARYYWLIVIFICMVLPFFVFPVTWIVCYACLGCIGQVGFNFNFNLYKMHGEYNIKYIIIIIYNNHASSFRGY
jgi:hypothetical protein